jgi:L-alanine-DL-glutamate epimerase-like enolase superfamily enzyme
VKITDIETIVLRLPVVSDIADSTQDAVVIRVHTDEGITGLGEVDASPFVIKAIVEAPKSHLISAGLKALLVGQNPLEPARLWDRMYEGTMFFGRRGATVMAMSGVDIALWDIAGQATGQPIYRLLGGGYRERVPAYASTLMPDTPEEAGREAERWASRGFRAVKMGWGGFGRGFESDAALVGAARRAVGPRVDLLLDLGFRWEGTHAIEGARLLGEFRPFWIEEPFLPDSLEQYARLADSTDIRIAAGEENTTRWEFAELIDRGHVDVIQPDVTRAGGLTECLRIARMAADRGRPCVPHAWSTGIVKAASLHLLAAIPNALFLEFCVWDSPLNLELVVPPFAIDAGGRVAVPQSPGLGVQLNEEVVARYRVA